MSYTPINWQTGDTITAEKMNKMDNGWSVETGPQTMFDDSVTTADAYNREELIVGSAPFATASELTVTLDNVEYDLTGFDDNGYWTWGAPYNDFSEYSFSIYIVNGSAMFVSQVAGTYSLKIEADARTVDTSADFQSAVKSIADGTATFQLIADATQYEDALSAVDAGRLIYFWYTDPILGSPRCYIVTGVSSVCTIVPTSSTFEARFPLDGGAFYINPLT